MTLKETPAAWRRGFRLYRRRTGTDSLGNETAVYDMDVPDEAVPAERGMDFQRPKSWNTAGSVTSGARVEPWGELTGGILEGYLRTELDIKEFDRLEVEGTLYEVKSLHRWPGHCKLMLQRTR